MGTCLFGGELIAIRVESILLYLVVVNQFGRILFFQTFTFTNAS